MLAYVLFCSIPCYGLSLGPVPGFLNSAGVAFSGWVLEMFGMIDSMMMMMIKAKIFGPTIYSRLIRMNDSPRQHMTPENSKNGVGTSI